jgi:hypothetical protein
MLCVFVLASCSSTPPPAPLAITHPETKEIAPGVFEVNVDARAGWVSTSVELKEDQKFKLHADGQWGESPGVQRTADGGQAGMFGSGYWGVTPLVPGPTLWGCLVARIGGGTPFAAGSEYSGKADRAGKLQLSINDGLDQMRDNHGTMRVRIELGQ